MKYTLENTVKIGNPVRVFVNGNEIKNAIEADTSRGEVLTCLDPPRLHKRKRDEVYFRKLRGAVTVETISEHEGKACLT